MPKSRKRRIKKHKVANVGKDLEQQYLQAVSKRVGNPDFPQKVRTSNGYAVSIRPELTGLLHEQLEAFREKFGRDPAGDDPIFFDPHNDHPTPINLQEYQEAVSSAMKEADISPGAIFAYNRTGIMLTEENLHLWTRKDIDEWKHAYLEYRNNQDCHEDFDDAQPPETFEDIVEFIKDITQNIIQLTVDKKSKAPALTMEDGLNLFDDEDEAGISFSTIFGTLTLWLTGAKERALDEKDAVEAVRWIAEHLDTEASQTTMLLGGLIGHPAAPDITFNEAFDTLGRDILPALIWLCSGVAATAGEGTAEWFRQFDRTPSLRARTSRQVRRIFRNFTR